MSILSRPDSVLTCHTHSWTLLRVEKAGIRLRISVTAGSKMRSDMKPDLLSILIGTNDAGQGVQPDGFESNYRFILDASFEANRSLRLVLLDPFVLRSGPLTDNAMWSSRRAAVDRLRDIVHQLAVEYDAVHIKLQDIFDAAAASVFPQHWLWDGVHPLPQGHELIARNWLQKVSARWPQI